MSDSNLVVRTMTTVRQFFFVVVCSIGGFIGPATQAETLIFAAAAGTVDTLTSEVIVREAYRRIGLIRGIKFTENNTVGMDTYAAHDYSGLFKMLERGRVQVALSPSLNGRYQMALLGVEGVSELRPPTARFDLFHYIHKIHADLQPRLEAVFRDMEASGQLAAIRDHVITVLLQRVEQGQGVCDDYACFEDGLDFLTRN